MWGPGSRISYQSAAHACPTVARAPHVPARGTQFLASRQQHGPRNGCSLVACSTAPSGYFQCFVKIVTNMVCKKQHLQVRSCISIISCIYEPFAFLILWTAGFLTGFFFFCTVRLRIIEIIMLGIILYQIYRGKYTDLSFDFMLILFKFSFSFKNCGKVQ